MRRKRCKTCGHLEPLDMQLSWAEGRLLGNKLTPKQIKELVRLAKDPKNTTGMLGKRFGISTGWTRRILLTFGIRRSRGRPRNDR